MKKIIKRTIVILILCMITVFIYIVLLFNNDAFAFLNNTLFVYDKYHISYPVAYKDVEIIENGNGIRVYKFKKITRWKKTPRWKKCTWTNTIDSSFNVFLKRHISSDNIFLDIYSKDNITVVLLNEHADKNDSVYLIHLFTDSGGVPSSLKFYEQICTNIPDKNKNE